MGSDTATDHRMTGVEWLLGSVDRYEQRRKERGKPVRWSEYFGTVALDKSATEPGAEADPEESLANRGEITLATLHSAKGLEWDFVFLIGLEEGNLPHRRVAAPRISDAIAGDLEEERRLFYVGITRARERLWLTRTAMRLDRGRELPRPPSRFVEELPADSIRSYEIAQQEELSPNAIEDMAAAFLAMTRPPPEPAP